jgi:glycosyltransferase
MKHLYLINETCRAANYGIGTYIKQLILALKEETMRLHVIHLNSFDHTELFIEMKDDVQYIYIPSVKYISKNNFQTIQKHYFQNAFFLLMPYLNKQEELIFHFNLMNGEEMLKLIKEKLKCKILLTVHYMDWSFELLGDTVKLRKALDNPETPEEKNIKASVDNEKQFINHCDKIITIAQHSFKTLKDIYSIPEEKITLVPNGLKDEFVPLSKEEHLSLKKHYGVSPQDFMIIFAGRIDPVKGVSILLEAFNLILTEYQNIRLYITGNGDYNEPLKKASPHWANVTFTGFVNKDELYNLYTIADIGVVPSLHEEFGYVALEMMMMNLPLVVSQTTGLSEMVEGGVNGLTADLSSSQDQQNDSSKILAEKILTLIGDDYIRKVYSENGRKRFLDVYEIKNFRKKMVGFYQKI